MTDLVDTRLILLRWILDELKRSQAANEAERKRLVRLSEDVQGLLESEPGPPTEREGLIKLGWTHAAVIGVHRPEVAYPTRKVKRSPSSITMIYTEPCTCPDKHTEVWVTPVVDQDLQQRLFY